MYNNNTHNEPHGQIYTHITTWHCTQAGQHTENNEHVVVYHHYQQKQHIDQYRFIRVNIFCNAEDDTGDNEIIS